MVTIVKHEWHSVDSQFAVELDLDLLGEIYPDKDEEELQAILDGVTDGTYEVEDIVNDAWENDVEIFWERQYDDWWTDRKGGYDITYELGDENSWHSEPPPPEPTHKCTKCRWKGQKYESHTLYLNEDGSIHKDDDLEFHSTKDVCPMCDSDLELTEEGKQKEVKLKKLMDDLDKEIFDDES
jgi:hypothetical protein